MLQFRRTPIRADAAVAHVDPRAVVRAAVADRVHRSTVGTGHIVNLFVCLTVGIPAFDHLHPLQRGAERIPRRPDQEVGRACFVRQQITAHGDSPLVQIADVVARGIDAVAGKETYLDAGTAGGEGLLAAEGIVDRIPGVGLCPDTGQTGRTPEPVVGV